MDLNPELTFSVWIANDRIYLATEATANGVCVGNNTNKNTIINNICVLNYCMCCVNINAVMYNGVYTFIIFYSSLTS